MQLQGQYLHKTNAENLAPEMMALSLKHFAVTNS